MFIIGLGERRKMTPKSWGYQGKFFSPILFFDFSTTDFKLFIIISNNDYKTIQELRPHTINQNKDSD
jgi:hypothetical protein